MQRSSVRAIVILNAYWVGLSFMWNSLHALVLPAVLLGLVPEAQKNTCLGLLTFAGLVVATLVQPLSGAVSDGWASRWGRRRPLMLLGTAFDFVFLTVMAGAGGLAGLAAGYIGLQLSSNVAHGPLQGLLPDQVPASRLGAASGVKNLFDMGGLVAASLLVGRLLPPGVRQPVTAVAVIAAVLALSAGVTLGGVREAPSHKPERRPARESLPSALRRDLRAHPAFWRLVASRFVYLLGVVGIQSFALYYVRDVLRAPDPALLTGNLLAALTLALIACALGGGWLGDRLGHRRVLLAAHGVSTLGCLLLLLARTPLSLLIFGGVLGAGIGLFLTANWALANTLAPAARAGRFMGYTNLATAGAGALGRLLGPLIDLLNNARPGAFLGYVMLFTFAAACTLLGALPLRRVGAGGGQGDLHRAQRPADPT